MLDSVGRVVERTFWAVCSRVLYCSIIAGTSASFFSLKQVVRWIGMVARKVV